MVTLAADGYGLNGTLSPSAFGYAGWSWQRDAAGFYEAYRPVFIVAAACYYPVVFGLREYMRERKPLDLGGKKTNCVLNWIFWWEAALAMFSILGAVQVVPMCLEPIWDGMSWSEAICKHRTYDDPRSFWILLFCLSKVFEFGDTIFIVLRKKPLVVLQHYHHLATMLFCWYGAVNGWRLQNTNPYFAGMNLLVHSVMYSWYAATRTGWRSPKALMIFITLIQLVQMVGGMVITMTAIFGSTEAGCGEWPKAEPLGATACMFMYASYFYLFAQLFYRNYLGGRKKKSQRQSSSSNSIQKKLD